jgi:SPP1 family predicted phage head-tail adaptor
MKPSDRYNSAYLVDGATLQQPTTVSSDGAGGGETEWQDVEHIWGRRETLTGNEALQAGAINSTLTDRFTMRYRSDLQASWRLVLDDGVTILRIVAKREVVRRQWLELDCTGAH